MNHPKEKAIPTDNSDSKLNLEIVQGNEKDWYFEQRESQKLHTAYEWEQDIFSCIRDGNVDRLDQILEHFRSNPVLVGKLSLNNLRQMQYLAVAFVTLATRYAIQGGMLEMDAYNKSDAYILEIDQLSSVDQIVGFIVNLLKMMTKEMHDLEKQKGSTKPIRKCLEYIYRNLHTKITLEDLARVACLSPQYLSSLFKKEMGKTITTYVLEQKINAAKNMLVQDGFSAKDVSNYLNFSSQSHFINSFKRVCGVTPFEYKRYQSNKL